MIEQFGLSPTQAKVILPGDQFGRLTVRATGQKGKYKYYAVCQCNCGSMIKAIRFDGLKSGAVSSCGCLHRERTTKHGKTGHIHHHRWVNMIDRCENTLCRAYKNYGGRGLTVCDRWHDFNAFLADLPGGYFPGAQLDRTNNNLGYRPGNVRWVTSAQNTNNRRVTVRVEYDGITRSLSEWSLITGLSAKLIWTRINAGWAAESALNTPKLSHHECGTRARASQLRAKALLI